MIEDQTITLSLDYHLLKYFKLVIVTGWVPQEAKKLEPAKSEGMLLQSTAVGTGRDNWAEGEVEH